MFAQSHETQSLCCVTISVSIMQDAYQVTKLTSAHENLHAAAICLRIGMQPSNDLGANLNELSKLFLVFNQPS